MAAPRRWSSKRSKPAPSASPEPKSRRPLPRRRSAAQPPSPPPPRWWRPRRRPLQRLRHAKPSGVVLRTLTEEERSARAHALADSRLREAEERKIAEEDARIREARDAIERVERDAAEARKREEDDRRRHDEETKRKADDVAKKRFGGEPEVKPRLTPAAAGARAITLEPEEEESIGASAPSWRRGSPCGGAEAGPRLTRQTPRPPYGHDRRPRRRSARALEGLVRTPHQAAHEGFRQ